MTNSSIDEQSENLLDQKKTIPYNDEQIHAAECPNKVGFVRTSSCNYESWHEIEGYGVNCKQWICPVCSKVLKNTLLDRIHAGLESEQEFYFMTLTSSYRDMDIKSAWNRFRNRLNYNYPIGRFVWVMELTPPSHEYINWKGVKSLSVGGLRHFHVLISFMDEIPSESKISVLWKAATFQKSWEIDFVRLHGIRSPAGYMAKYVTKALNFGYYTRERRVGFSRNFPKLKSNLLPLPGVYLPYDPRYDIPESEPFDELLSDLRNPKNLKGKRYL